MKRARLKDTRVWRDGKRTYKEVYAAVEKGAGSVLLSLSLDTNRDTEIRVSEEGFQQLYNALFEARANALVNRRRN